MTIIKAGPCGGDGGQLKTIHKIHHIVKIDVYHSTYINAITITYIVDGEEKTVTWGKQGGTPTEKKNEVENKTCYPILPGPFEQITLKNGEYITSVKGYYGKHGNDDWIGLRALIIETSETPDPPVYGIEVGTKFELPAINGKIIGFFGRSGERLDALGVYIKVE